MLLIIYSILTMKYRLVYTMLSSLSMVVYSSSGQQDYDACYKACTTDFIPQIVNLVPRERVYSDYEGLLPYWSTCQYRCYRCRIPGANIAMEKLKKVFDDNLQNASQIIVDIAIIIESIDRSLDQSCYSPWHYANNVNDTESIF